MQIEIIREVKNLKGGKERAYEDDHRLCDQNGSVPG